MNDAWLIEGLSLNKQFPGCVRSGFCCKQGPCPFGDWNEAKSQCKHLVGSEPGQYACGIFDEIVGQPGAEEAPAFGTGCCSGMNDDRLEILKQRV